LANFFNDFSLVNGIISVSYIWASLRLYYVAQVTVLALALAPWAELKQINCCHSERKSVASFCHQVAALVPDMFCKFYLVKNYKVTQ
jgi:hypothetical protein